MPGHKIGQADKTPVALVQHDDMVSHLGQIGDQICRKEGDPASAMAGEQGVQVPGLLRV